MPHLDDVTASDLRRALGRRRRKRRGLERILHAPPNDAGYDASSWTPSPVRRFVDETFAVTYSASICRRLMRESGLVYRRLSDASPDRWIPRIA